MTARRLPPYGKQIRDARRSGDLSRYHGTSTDGQQPTIWLCVGPEAWHAARDWSPHRLVTLLPPGDDPDKYNWRCLAGADPILLWRCGEVDGDALRRLLEAVMRDGTDRVFDLVTGTRYRAKVREVKHAAA